MNRRMNRVYLLVVAVLVLTMTGCGKKLGEVSGTVNFVNQPVPQATITFFDEEGHAISGEVIDGRFSLTNVPVGENVKAVVTTKAQLEEIKNYEQRENLVAGKGRVERPLPPVASRSPLRKRLQEEQNVPEHQEVTKRMQEMKQRVWVLPERYQAVETTPLVYTITPGPQQLTVALEAQ